MPAARRPAARKPTAKKRAPRAVPRVTNDETDVAALRMLLLPLQSQADLLERLQRVHGLPGDAPSPLPIATGADGAPSIDEALAWLDERQQAVLDDFPQRIIDLLEQQAT